MLSRSDANPSTERCFGVTIPAMATRLVIRGEHRLDLQTLKARVDERIAHYDARYPHLNIRGHYRWLDERRAEAEYRGGKGRVTLGEREVTVEMELPFFAKPFKGRIEQFVAKEMDLVTRAQ